MQSAEPASATQLRINLVDREGETTGTGSESKKGFTLQVTDSTGAPVSESAVVFRLPDEGASGLFADGSHSAIVYTSADGLAKISGIKWSDTPGSVSIKVTATKGEARAGFLLMETLAPKSAFTAVASAPAAAPVVSAPVVSAPALVSDKPQARMAMAPRESTTAQPGVSVSQVKGSSSLPKATEISAQQPPAQPVVSVVNNKKGDAGYHSSHKKWIILAAVIAGAAGAGLALGGKKKSTTTSTTTTGVTVGTPTVSVGQP